MAHLVTLLRRVLVVAVIGVLGGTCAPPPPSMGPEARVTRVYDGDTIEVEFEGAKERVRYIGIDTPERDDRRALILEMARLATDANRSLVAGRSVRLEFDVDRRDRYDRLLAYVFVGDTLVNEWLVREGFAQAREYRPNVRHQERLFEAQRKAKAERLRLWDGRLPSERLR